MKSFEINHDNLNPALYRHSTSGFVQTWDVRIKKPNSGDYMSPAVIHTIEHTMAHYLRERYGDYRIVGVFPMGCQTGFYVLTRFMTRYHFYDAMESYIMSLQRMYSVPGATSRECGQYLLQDLRGAKDTMMQFYEDWMRRNRDEVLDYKD